MTVRELKEKLTHADDNAEVLLWVYSDPDSNDREATSVADAKADVAVFHIMAE